MNSITSKVLPAGFRTALAGQSRDFAESSSSLVFAFIFAILLIYLVLAAQFESLIDPFIILLTVPMAVTGALLSLWITHQSINIFSEIGIIMLIGLITKNGILIVEFANQRKAEGMNPFVMPHWQQPHPGFVPILMTTLAMIFGTLPIALSLGDIFRKPDIPRHRSRRRINIRRHTTLFVIPAVYSYFSRPYKAKLETRPGIAIASPEV